MQLQYRNGQIVEAVVLSQTDSVMRVMPQGFDDVVELRRINGGWVSDDCEPVVIKFSWENPAPAALSEEDFICPPELAARLVNMLFAADEPNAEPAPRTLTAGAAPGSVVV